MASVDLPYVDRFRAKGRTYWYFRQGRTRTRLPGQPGDAGFMAAYQASLAAATAGGGDGPGAGTMAALIDAYQASPAWRDLSPATRRDYDKFLPTFRERYGEGRVATLTRAWVFKLRDRYAAEVSNRTANKAVAVLSVLLTWAMDHGWRPDNPALRPKKLRVAGGYRAWTGDEINRFLAMAPPNVRLACLLGLGTGQRAQDLCRMTWGAYRGGEIEVTQAKTGARVWIPVHGRLAEALEAASNATHMPIEAKAARNRAQPRVIELHAAKTILVSPRGLPYTPGNLSHDVLDAVRAAGLPDGLVMHGWRTTALTWLAEAGCTPHEIMAISGHNTPQMVSRYTRDASRKAMGRAAVVKLRKEGR